jgi:hypothetical protein
MGARVEECIHSPPRQLRHIRRVRNDVDDDTSNHCPTSDSLAVVLQTMLVIALAMNSSHISLLCSPPFGSTVHIGTLVAWHTEGQRPSVPIRERCELSGIQFHCA